MCRYSDKEYKSHFACLKHRHSAKFPKYAHPKCPTCQQPMTHMGRDFKPPKAEDKKAWARLIPGGYDSCGC
jgi:tRNA(Ile2) C34 agmatinyltransferase TiaS